jgi:uncharacterized protein (DUF433 family)
MIAQFLPGGLSKSGIDEQGGGDATMTVVQRHRTPAIDSQITESYGELAWQRIRNCKPYAMQ